MSSFFLGRVGGSVFFVKDWRGMEGVVIGFF